MKNFKRACEKALRNTPRTSTLRLNLGRERRKNYITQAARRRASTAHGVGGHGDGDGLSFPVVDHHYE